MTSDFVFFFPFPGVEQVARNIFCRLLRATTTRWLLLSLFLACFSVLGQAQESAWFEVKPGGTYQTRFLLSTDIPSDQQSSLRELLQKHLSIHEAMQNPRMNESEWRRLIQKTPQEIADLLATEGYFKTKTTVYQPAAQVAEFRLTLPPQAKVATVDVAITGEIQQAQYQNTLESAQKSWPLPVNSVFTQAAWSSAKKELLATCRIPQCKNHPFASAGQSANAGSLYSAGGRLRPGRAFWPGEDSWITALP